MRSFVPFALLGLAACTGSASGTVSGGSGSLSGTVANTTFSVASTYAIVGSDSASSCVDGGDGGASCVTTTPGGFSASISLTNRADATCATLESDEAANKNVAFANLEAVTFFVNFPGAAETGTFPVSDLSDAVPPPATGPVVYVQFGTTTSICATGLDVAGTTGSLTLTQASESNLAGTYTVTFGAQGTLTGSFDVAVCAYKAGALGVCE